ncbi:hypothetical protein ABTE42_21425, partial [Acinetobacter baumannii]
MAGVDRRIVLLASPALVLEYEAVLKRSEHVLAAGVDEAAVDVILDMIVARAEHVQMHYLWRPQLADVGDE